MREGDRNTVFFHANATARAQVNQVDALQNMHGTVHRDRGAMENVVLQYFADMFSSTQPNDVLMGEALNAIEPRVSAEENHRLTLHFSAKEVTDALSSMSPLKSPGPDGFPTLFYKRFWNIIGPNVISGVLDFLNTKSLPLPLNFTFILLIPKVKNPSKMIDFRSY